MLMQSVEVGGTRGGEHRLLRLDDRPGADRPDLLCSPDVRAAPQSSLGRSSSLRPLLLNLLSVGAAYGILVPCSSTRRGRPLGFHSGHDRGVGAFFLFSVLFGSSMDYQVSCLAGSRAYDAHSGDTRDASSSWGVASTARIITGGAHHHRRLPRLRDGRHGHVPADGLRHRHRPPPRRDRDQASSYRADRPARRWNSYLPSWLGWLPRRRGGERVPRKREDHAPRNPLEEGEPWLASESDVVRFFDADLRLQSSQRTGMQTCGVGLALSFSFLLADPARYRKYGTRR